jgi:D-galactarolactone isomerase
MNGDHTTLQAWPRPETPRGGCDCHVHIFDRRFPLPGVDPSTIPDAPALAYQVVQQALCLERTVLVQANVYGTDNTCMLEALQVLGVATTRAIVAVEPDAAVSDLMPLSDQGACGIRFHMLRGGFLTWDALESLAARAADLDWHIQLQMDGRDLPQYLDRLKRLPCPLVIDHVGKFLEPVTIEHPGFRSLLRLLDGGRTWVKLSAAYEVSRSGPPRYEDVGALAKALVRHAPQRMLWASNWPHPSVKVPPRDEDLLNLLAGWAPEPQIRTAILVDNPADLYRFAATPVFPRPTPA